MLRSGCVWPDLACGQVPLYASLVNFRATAQLLGACPHGHVLSGCYGYGFRHGRGLLGACVSTPADRDGQPPEPDESVPMAALAATVPLPDGPRLCSLDLGKPLRCPAEGGDVCVSSYIECLRLLHAAEAQGV